MTIAVYPGSFDPVTLGHLDVITRAARIFEEVRVCVMKNVSKRYCFNESERLALLAESTRALPNVTVDHYEGLLTDYARSVQANVVVKGLRTIADFEYEMQMDYFNKRLAPEIETFYLVADTRYSVLSSTAIRELMAFGGDLTGLVPDPVIRAVKDRQGGNTQ
jgi:pantetheine-phosphate adenylyltransferase